MSQPFLSRRLEARPGMVYTCIHPTPRDPTVPYFVRKGTKIIVHKPSGEVTQHACKADTVFQAFEKVAELRTLQFKRDGFLVTVAAADVTEVHFKCPQCGGRSEIEGLCEGCRRRWLPGR